MKNSYLGDAVLNSNGRADPHVVDFFFEVERQLDGSGVPIAFPAATQTTATADMWAKGWRLHFWLDDSIANNVDWWNEGQFTVDCGQTDNEMEATYHDATTDGLTWEVFIMETECNGAQTAGQAILPGNAITLNAGLINALPGFCTVTSAQQWVKTFHHEHGHNLNLAHYNPQAGVPSPWMVSGCQPTGGVFVEFTAAEWRATSTAWLG
jgi:hypothetical protein